MKWDNVAAELCRSGIREKFVQNPTLLEILVKRTGTKCIVECAKDRLWGTGIPLAQEDCLNSDRWITPGIMGKVLEDIRMEFCNHFGSNQNPLIGIQHAASHHPNGHVQDDNPNGLRPSMFLQPVTPNEELGLSQPHNEATTMELEEPSNIQPINIETNNSSQK